MNLLPWKKNARPSLSLSLFFSFSFFPFLSFPFFFFSFPFPTPVSREIVLTRWSNDGRRNGKGRFFLRCFHDRQTERERERVEIFSRKEQRSPLVSVKDPALSRRVCIIFRESDSLESLSSPKREGQRETRKLEWRRPLWRNQKSSSPWDG